MRIEISEEAVADLLEYARVPIGFEVRRVLDIAGERGNDKRYVLAERVLEVPFTKDYDAVAGEGPGQWARRFDVSTWGFFAARMDGRRVGGAAVAFRTKGLVMLEDREDLAVLWDIRVSPDARGHGVGSALFATAEGWARKRGCRQLKVETQNINVPACRFYARQGFTLGAIDRSAYPDHPDEVQLLWYKDLPAPAPVSRGDS